MHDTGIIDVMEGICHYCGNIGIVQREHVIPKSRGGSGSMDNIVMACVPCNMDKFDFTPEEWRAWREENSLEWPPVWNWEQLAAAAKRHEQAQNFGRNFGGTGFAGREYYDSQEFRAKYSAVATDQWAPGGILRSMTWSRAPGGRFASAIAELAACSKEGFTAQDLRTHLGAECVKGYVRTAIRQGIIVRIGHGRYAAAPPGAMAAAAERAAIGRGTSYETRWGRK